jgi:broad specificity phosphatase PhoE
MQNRYILMRHGETKYQANHSGIFYPKKEYFNISITQRAKKQIKKTAELLKKENIDLIYSSDLYRTKQTAGIVAKELGLKVHCDKRLRDMVFGTFAGRPGSDFRKQFSSKIQRFAKRIGGAENWRDVKKRAVSFLKEVDKKYKNKTILIVSHADPLWLLAGYIKGLTEKELLENRDFDKLLPYVGQVIKP